MPASGGSDQLSQVLTVPAQSVVTATWTVPVFRNDTLWTRLEETGARNWSDFTTIQPAADIQLGMIDPPPYFSGQPATVIVTVTSQSPVTITPQLDLSVSKYRRPGWDLVSNQSIT